MGKMKLQFTCQQGGKCCKKYAGTIIASPEDIVRWRAIGREDILKHVRTFKSDEETVIGGEFCEDPKSGKEPKNCPFIDLSGDKSICTIHDVKPTACRNYPYGEDGKIREDLIGVCDGIVKVRI